MRALDVGRLAVPGIALPVHRMLGRILVETFPPYGVIVEVVHDIREDGALTGRRERVGVGLLVGAGSDAEEAVLGVDRPKSAVFADADPCDVVADALYFIARVAEMLGRDEHREVGLAARGGERRRDVLLFAVRPLDAEDEHVLRHPAFLSSEVGRNSQREALLAEQNVSAVTGVDRPDRVILREVHDPSVLLVDVALCVETLDEIAVLAERVQALLAHARHDDHIQNDIDGIGDLDADLGECGTDHAHRIGDNVHRSSLHLAARNVLAHLVTLFGALPDVRGTRVLFLGQADDRSRLYARNVVDRRSVQIAIGKEFLIEFDHLARGDRLCAKRLDLLLRAVDPDDLVRRRESRALLDKLQYFLIICHGFLSSKNFYSEMKYTTNKTKGKAFALIFLQNRLSRKFHGIFAAKRPITPKCALVCAAFFDIIVP